MNITEARHAGGRGARRVGVRCPTTASGRASRAHIGEAGLRPRRAHPLRARPRQPRWPTADLHVRDPDSLDRWRPTCRAARRGRRGGRRDAQGRRAHPGRRARYERAVAGAAIDSGADVVVGHHPHIMRGVEVYRGKPIFHGLGNFVSVTPRSPPARPRRGRAGGVSMRRRELFGFAPDPDMPQYPFHPESRNTSIATAGSTATAWSRRARAVLDRRHREPGAAGRWRERRRRRLHRADHRAAGLTTAYRWGGDRVVCA